MRVPLLFLALLAWAVTNAQEADSTWTCEATIGLYVFSNDLIALPVFEADKDHLHLEARYNYEDLRTGSAWIGYNFMGGGKIAYEVTPMIGVVAGAGNGVAIGLEFEFALGGLTLYSEAEHLFDLNTAENDFFYAWTDLTYALHDRFYFGISGQRTRLYDSRSEIQHGLVIGSAFGDLDASVYFYDPEMDDRFLLLTLTYAF